MSESSVPRPTTREERGLDIFRRGAIERVAGDLYIVDSCTHRGRDYLVDLDSQRCECEDSRRGHFCKHLFASLLYKSWIRRAARTIGHAVVNS